MFVNEAVGTAHFQILDPDAAVAVTKVGDLVTFTYGQGIGDLRLTMPLAVAKSQADHLAVLFGLSVTP